MPDHAPTPGGVFLSYAREDTDAARRIADALRGFGVEVWFDQSELRGGDQWDAKIRGQIKSCALFIPIISTTTQTREEAYFRLEWKLADDRSHLMAPGKPFIVPVVIDNTPESGAVVPDSFSRSQWTRLSEGAPSTQFVERVNHLLQAPRKPALKPNLPRPPTLPPMLKQAARAKAVAGLAEAGHPGSTTPATTKSLFGWAWGALATVLVIVAAGVFLWLRQPAAESPRDLRQDAAATTAPSPATAAADKSIAVLPFANLSDDKESAFFTDGIQEDILTNLSNIRELRVVSRTSVMQYRETTKPMPQIARELGVAYILEGSVRRAGNKVRVTGQLIRAGTDEHVWAKAYDRDLTDIFAIQAELSQEIATALSAALSPQEKTLLTQRPTANPAAYELVLKAREIRHLPASTSNWIQPQIDLLQGAIKLDPNYVTAHADLASLYVFWYFIGTPDAALLGKARAALEAATRLAPDAPEVILARADYFYYGQHDFARAMEHYDRLAQLRPNDPALLNRVGAILRRQGRWLEALAVYRRLAELDPADQRNRRDTAILLAAGRRFGEAQAEMQRYVDRSPDLLLGRYELAYLAYIGSGSTREMEQFLGSLTPAQRESREGQGFQFVWARRHCDLDEAVRLDRGAPASATAALEMAMIYTIRGDRETARRRFGKFPADLRAQIATTPDDFSAWSALGEIEAMLGNKEEALRCVRRAIEIMPESRDTLIGPTLRARLAFVYAWTGDKEAAISEYTHLLRTPFGAMNGGGGNLADATVAVMKLDPRYAPLRGDPRFEALLNDPKNNQPLF